MEEIAAAGRRTVARLGEENASWTTIIVLPNDAYAAIESLSAPRMDKWTIRIINNGKQGTLAIITNRDGFWYVTTASGNFKYRPFEAPLPFPVSYYFRARSDIPLILNGVGQNSLRLQSLQDGVAIYSAPLSQESTRQHQAILRNVEALEQRQPDQVSPQHLSAKKRAESALRDGIIAKLDLKTGVIRQDGAVGNRVWIEDFQWRTETEEQLFDIRDREWEDRTQAIAAPDERDDLILIAHQPGWKQGDPIKDMEYLMLNIRTGESRRVPYQYGQTVNGSFSTSRKQVFAVGRIANDGSVGLFEIDLASGENVPLAGPELYSGTILTTAPSADGQRIAVMKKLNGKTENRSQLYVLRFANGRAQAIGKPLETGVISWHPDDKSIITTIRETPAIGQPSASMICRIDMDGAVTRLAEGKNPSVLVGPNRILFQDNAADTWHTCDLDGKDRRQIGDGLKGFDLASPSPNGDRAVMIQSDAPDGPRPFIIDLATGETTPIPVGAGLWAYPSWR